MKNNIGIDKKIRKKKIGLIFILLLLMITIFLILLTKTDFFHLSKIEIVGNKSLDKEKITMASGLLLDENIFKININRVEENLLSHPYIKDVNVKRKLPNKVSIAVKERIESIVVPYIGSYIYLDDEGVILNILATKKSDSLMEIKGLDLEAVAIGHKAILADNRDIDDIVQFIELCKKQDLLENIEYIDFSAESNTFFVLKSGTKVAFGTLNNVQYKLRYILAIIDKRKEQNLNLRGTIDFTKGEYPVFSEESF